MQDRSVDERKTPSRTPREEKHPELHNALRFLREQARLGQAEVAERVRERGTSLSAVYYSQCERGLRYPSPPLLDTILDVLGSDQAQLAVMLIAPPWRAQAAGEVVPEPGSGHYRTRRSSPKPLMRGLTAYAGGPEAVSFGATPQDQAKGLMPSAQMLNSMAARSDASYAGPAPYDAEREAALDEILEGARELPRADLLTVRGVVRSMRRRD